MNELTDDQIFDDDFFAAIDIVHAEWTHDGPTTEEPGPRVVGGYSVEAHPHPVYFWSKIVQEKLLRTRQMFRMSLKADYHPSKSEST